jgi:two-component system, cell cycle sensor histidine kinase and response regulator CckA
VPESGPARKERAGKAAILVIDGEPLVRSLVRMTLAHDGYHVLTASCGAEALDLSRGYLEAIDVVVIDVKWPYVIGTETELAATIVKTILKERPGIHVLLMTDKAIRGISPRLRRELLLKPFLPRQLLERIHQVLTNEQDLP